VSTRAERQLRPEVQISWAGQGLRENSPMPLNIIVTATVKDERGLGEPLFILWIFSCLSIAQGVNVLSAVPLLDRMVSLDVNQHLKKNDRAQVVCDSRGGCPGIPAPVSPYGLCGR